MSGHLIIANLIAPTFLVLGRRAGIFILVGIIIFEWIAVWFFFNKVVKTKISWRRLLLISLIANIFSAVLGLLLGSMVSLYAAFNWKNLPKNLLVLLLAWISSILVEWIFYAAPIHLNSFKNKVWIGLKSTVLANSFSYIILIVYIIVISTWLPEYPRFNLPNIEAVSNIGSVLRAQKEFYLDNSRFATTFRQLKELDLRITGQTNTQWEGFYFRYNLDADRVKAQVTAVPKVAIARGKTLWSYTAILFAKPKFVYGICQSEQASNIAPEPPHIVQGEIKCPPGSILREVIYSDL